MISYFAAVLAAAFETAVVALVGLLIHFILTVGGRLLLDSSEYTSSYSSILIVLIFVLIKNHNDND